MHSLAFVDLTPDHGYCGVMNSSAIHDVVHLTVNEFASAFSARHLAEQSQPEGTINSKIHNHFIAELGDEVRYFSSLARSLDSSLGNMLEALAIRLALANYEVARFVSGHISTSQTNHIASLLEAYKARRRRPAVADYEGVLLALSTDGSSIEKRHESDYCLRDVDTGVRYLVELKIGGDLDNKKARSEKEALLEQYAILVNSLQTDELVKIRFATAYNRYGEGRSWRQERVRQFFADDELLISKDFWALVTKRPDGGAVVQEAYALAAPALREALDRVRDAYLK